MKTLKVLLLLLIIFCFSNCRKVELEKDSKIDNIEFSYTSGLRIPYNKVDVNILRTNNSANAEAFIHCEPLSNDTKWIYSKIDTMVEIDNKVFEKLVNSTILLKRINMDKAYSQGFDGSTWKIEFGSKGKNMSYSFWSPLSNQEARGLTDFVNLSEEILDKVGLNTKEILEN